MAKKKKVINLSEQNISYIEDERVIKIIAFNPNTMEVDISITVQDEKKRVMKLPFAHLPKEIKKLVRPI
jgi:hypothetical protein